MTDDGVPASLTWTTPTSEPYVVDGRASISGGMPIGNGETAALLFPVQRPFNTTDTFRVGAGVHLVLTMATAMASDTALMPLALVSIETDPPLGTSDFRQSLHLANATATVSSSVGSVTAWVDAESSRAELNVRSTGVAAFRSINVTVQSLRPMGRFNYSTRCGSSTSPADVWSRPAGEHSIGLHHHNDDADTSSWLKCAPRQPDRVPVCAGHVHHRAFFNSTLAQQGLGHLTAQLQASDRWRHRSFGLVVSASGLERVGASDEDSGAGPPFGAHTRYRRRRLATTRPMRATDVTITTLSAQGSGSGSWTAEAAAMHATNVRRTSSVARREGHDAYWRRFWARSHIVVTSTTRDVTNLTARYAQTRYVQAVQAGTWVPIKFNGGLWSGAAQLPPETPHSGPTYRLFGSSTWWQNARLAYWSMLAPADFGALATLFEWYMQMLPLLEARTPLVFNHSGIYTTETSTLFGTYDPCDYGSPAGIRNQSRLPLGYEENRFLRFVSLHSQPGGRTEATGADLIWCLRGV